ncbi:Heterokaryon incompatibility protein 6, OR allele [Colletotrichum sp. SAR 10_65]|nr:Heterokaryon incompatibility protein 6, OR allele [Colletotrichum sp. SAR 10_65]
MSTITYREGLSGQQIRLLRLLPGEWLEDLAAELYVADRDQKYVALSYAWGSSRRSNKIIVNRHVHLITFNLDRALRAIRPTTESIVIWVDSVCINQEDAVEKSHQVGLMHDIFGSATEVIAYVGDGLDRSRQDYPRRFARLGLADPVRFTGKRTDLPIIERSISLWQNPMRSSEPRDKIFALLRLALDLEKDALLSIDTDYNVSVHTLFARVAYRIIKQTGLLWVTTFDLLAKTRNDVPSWVPDWSSDYAVPGWDQHRVRLHGELFQMFNASRARFLHSKQDGSEDLYVLPQRHFRRTEHGDFKTTRIRSEDSCWVEDTIRAVASGSRLFLTSKGQLGLGPEKMRSGDEVCILEGGLMPHVLRKRSEKRGVTMVGTCYVEGLMHWGGEAGYDGDNAKDTEGLEHKLRRRLQDRDISEEDFLLY